jgi:hypothetical protein
MKKLCLKTSGAEKQNSLPLPFEMDGWRKTICFAYSGCQKTFRIQTFFSTTTYAAIPSLAIL